MGERNQWKIIDSDPTDGLMLNSDMCLAYDNNSIHQECMAANNFNNRKCKKLQSKGKMCGTEIPARGKESKFEKVKEACCANAHPDSTGDCDSSAWPKGQAFSHVLLFAADEQQWLESFSQAWKIATENGHLDLLRL